MIHYDESDLLIKRYANERHSSVPANFFVPDIKYAREARALVLSLLGLISSILIWKVYYYYLSIKLIIGEVLSGHFNEIQYPIQDLDDPDQPIIELERVQYVKFICMLQITEGPFSAFQRFRSIPSFASGEEHLNYTLGISKRLNWFILFFVLLYGFVYVSLSQKTKDFANPEHRKEFVENYIYSRAYDREPCDGYSTLLKARATYQNVGRDLHTSIYKYKENIQVFKKEASYIDFACRAIRNFRRDFKRDKERALNRIPIKIMFERYPSLRQKFYEDALSGKLTKGVR